MPLYLPDPCLLQVSMYLSLPHSLETVAIITLAVPGLSSPKRTETVSKCRSHSGPPRLTQSVASTPPRLKPTCPAPPLVSAHLETSSRSTLLFQQPHSTCRPSSLLCCCLAISLLIPFLLWLLHLPQRPSQMDTGPTCILQSCLPVSQGSAFYRNSQFTQIADFQRGDRHSSFVPLIAECSAQTEADLHPTVFTCKYWSVGVSCFSAQNLFSGLVLP